jgi:DNA-binding NtrC family response regulator
MTRPLVLVVEDSEPIADLLAVVLDLDGLDTRLVTHAFDRLLDPASPLWHGLSAVCTDLQLGDVVTGVDILAVAAHDHPHLRRIALTASLDELLDQARPLAHAVLPKPAPFDDIAVELRQAAR